MFCPACGTKNKKGSQFCGNCGFDLSSLAKKKKAKPVKKKGGYGWILGLFLFAVLAICAFLFIHANFELDIPFADELHLDFLEIDLSGINLPDWLPFSDAIEEKQNGSGSIRDRQKSQSDEDESEAEEETAEEVVEEEAPAVEVAAEEAPAPERRMNLVSWSGEEISDWTISNDAYTFTAGELHADGKNEDQSDRYRIIFDAKINHETDDSLIISYSGMLKTDGNPQSGRGISVVLVSGSDGYDLNLQNGYVQGTSTNQHSISLSYRDGVSIYDIITSDFEPEFDREYQIQATRGSGSWFLFVDDIVVGTAEDPLGLTSFNKIHLPLTGSVMVKDIRISNY